MFFLFFLLQFIYGITNYEKSIPEIVVKIPITVVFIGNHKNTKTNSISQELKQKWFKDLTHTDEQTEINETSQFITEEVSKSPPLKYNFVFSSFDLPSDVHTAFEKALNYASCRFDEENDQKFVHSNVVENLLQSIVEYFQIPGIVFFPLNLDQKLRNINFCQGIPTTFNTTSVTNQKKKAYPEQLEIEENIQHGDKEKWSEQIYDLIKRTKNGETTYLTGWNDKESLFIRINSSETLSEELQMISFKQSKCSDKWFTNGRILWANMRQTLDDAFTHKYTSASTPENNEEQLSELKKQFEQFCKQQEQTKKQEDYCNNVMEKIKELSAQPVNRNKQDQNTLAYMGALSAILIDGLKEVVAPVTPTFLTPFSDVFRIDVTLFNDSKKIFPKEKFKSLFDQLLLPGVTAEYKFENMDFLEWPGISIPINTKVSECMSSIVDEQRKKYYRCTSPEYFREDLSGFEVPHELTSEKGANISKRELVCNIIVGNSLPILISKRSTSFAFDYVTLGTYTSLRNDIRPILRSILIHMYGISSTEKWNSPTILSTNSSHTSLGRLSKDAAYRNAMRSILSKGRTKIIKRLGEVTELLKLIGEYNIQSSFSFEYLDKQAEMYSDSLYKILKYTEKFEFETMREYLYKHKSLQKQFSKQLKAIIKELNDQLCNVAPSIIVQKGTKMWDRIDSISLLVMPVWLGILCVSLLALFIVMTRKIKSA